MSQKTMFIMTLLAALFLSACAGTASSPSATPEGHTMPMGEPTAETGGAQAQPTSEAEGTEAEPTAEMGMDHGMMGGETMQELSTLEGDAFEIAFMDAMIPHHQSAIDMAEIALERAQHEELRSAAQEIIDAQQAEIDEMTGWLQEWHDTAPSGEDHGMGMPDEIEHLRTVAEEEFDVAFLEAMIPHHQAAIQMATLVGERTDRPELNTLAEAIMETQEAENEQFATWKEAWEAE